MKIAWGILASVTILLMSCAAMNTHVTLFYPPLANATQSPAATTMPLNHITRQAFEVEVIDARTEKILAVTSTWKEGGKPVTWAEADNDPAEWVKQALLLHLKQAGCCSSDLTNSGSHSVYTVSCTLKCLTFHTLPPSKIPAYAYIVGTSRRLKATGICYDIVLRSGDKILCQDHIDGDYLVEETLFARKEHETNFFALALQDACNKTMILIDRCLEKEEAGSPQQTTPNP